MSFTVRHTTSATSGAVVSAVICPSDANTQAEIRDMSAFLRTLTEAGQKNAPVYKTHNAG